MKTKSRDNSGSGVRQAAAEHLSGTNGISISPPGNAPLTITPTSSVTQLYSLSKSNSKTFADTMSDKRVDASFWRKSGMTKNFAFNKNDDTIWAHSQENRHAEPGILMRSAALHPGANYTLVTERAPCDWCGPDITQAEVDGGITIDVKYFVEHDDDAKDNLVTFYEQWWSF